VVPEAHGSFGEVEVLLELSDRPVTTLGHGAFFGEQALLQVDGRANSYIRVKGNFEGFCMSKERFAVLTAEFPHFHAHVQAVHARRQARQAWRTASNKMRMVARTSLLSRALGAARRPSKAPTALSRGTTSRFALPTALSRGTTSRFALPGSSAQAGVQRSKTMLGGTRNQRKTARAW
jgi:CRP-like cAMP-binding protein